MGYTCQGVKMEFCCSMGYGLQFFSLWSLICRITVSDSFSKKSDLLMTISAIPLSLGSTISKCIFAEIIFKKRKIISRLLPSPVCHLGWGVGCLMRSEFEGKLWAEADTCICDIWIQQTKPAQGHILASVGGFVWELHWALLLLDSVHFKQWSCFRVYLAISVTLVQHMFLLMWRQQDWVSL